jgi:hypothetical protein
MAVLALDNLKGGLPHLAVERGSSHFQAALFCFETGGHQVGVIMPVNDFNPAGNAYSLIDNYNVTYIQSRSATPRKFIMRMSYARCAFASVVTVVHLIFS